MWGACAVIALGLLQSSLAQSVTPRPVTPADAESGRRSPAPVAVQSAATPRVAPPVISEETVEMSPFLVSSDKDTGYLAASTLAGTRLNTVVFDVAAST